MEAMLWALSVFVVVVREGPGARLGSTKPLYGATGKGTGTIAFASTRRYLRGGSEGSRAIYGETARGKGELRETRRNTGGSEWSDFTVPPYHGSFAAHAEREACGGVMGRVRGDGRGSGWPRVRTRAP